MLKDEEKEARFYEAVHLHSGREFDKSVPIFEELANGDYAPAQYMLGFFYFNGDGVKQDYEIAINWYFKAAEQGHPEACRKIQDLQDRGIIKIQKQETQYETTFNYILTHKVIPYMVFSNADFFYETILTNRGNMNIFLQQAVENAKSIADENPRIEPAYPIEKFDIFVFGDSPENGGISIVMPKSNKELDCAEIAFPFAARRYFTLEMSYDYVKQTGCFIVGEWEPKDEGFAHNNYGPLELTSRTSFPDRVISLI
jgi:TPR repeat protein